MLSCRGNSLLEALIALLITSTVITAVLRAYPTNLLTRTRSSITQLTTHAAIQDELNLISQSCVEAVTKPQLIPNIMALLGPFSDIARPMPHSVAIVSAKLTNTSIAYVELAQSTATHIQVRQTDSAPSSHALGCTPTTCIELECFRRKCSALDDSVLWINSPSESARILPFISFVYSLDEVTLLYLSNRNTLRRLQLVGKKKISENQPVLDGVTLFEPSITTQLQLGNTCIIEARYQTTLEPNRDFHIRSIQVVASPILPINFFRFERL